MDEGQGIQKEGTGGENLAFRYLYGFAILFVVLSHCDGGGVEMLSNWMHFGAFHLAVFVFGSGYFFSEKKLNAPHLYFWSKVKRLLIPLWCWNLFYGILLTLLHGLGFTFGEPLSIRGLLLFPINSENLYVLNMGSWFIFPFFCVQILYGAGKVLLDLLWKTKMADRLLQAVFIIAGFAGVYLAGHGYHEAVLYPVFRVLYFMPFYVFGMLYRDFMEKVFSRIPAALCMGACLFISLLLKAHFGKAVYVIPSSCDYPFGIGATYLAGAVGILFWLKVAMLLADFGKQCTPLLILGRSTWDIMFHQFAGIMAVKAVFAAGSRFLGIFQDFDFAAFFGDIWYLYRPGGIQEFALLYVLGAIAMPLAVKAFLQKRRRMNQGGDGKMKMEAVIFDMDGVIFDSENLYIQCWQAVAEKYGISGIEEACYECLGINSILTRELMLKRFGEDFPYDVYSKEVSALFHKRAEGGKLVQKPGVKELLSYLKETGVKIALASSTRKAVVVKELEEGGLLPYFDAIIGGDMVNRSKPEPDIFLKACESLGVAPGKAFAIEDSHNGIRSAYRAGMKPVMVPDLMGPIEEIEKISHVILPSLIEVKTYFEKEKYFAGI